MVLLDEPSASVDPFARDCMRNVLHSFKQGRCLLFTSHNLEEATILCDEIGLMDKGKMIVSGEINHLLTQYVPTIQVEVDIAKLTLEKSIHILKSFTISYG